MTSTTPEHGRPTQIPGAASPEVAVGAGLGAPPDETLLLEIEAAAVEIAGHAGKILGDHFGGQLTVEYKDTERQRDPVTSADKASQDYLLGQIKQRFPQHGILSEEDPGSEQPSPDILWVLDPLDGTTNFLNGLPAYAVSIGVLYRGRPVVGSIYLPWPGPKDGFVLHSRRGGGCFADDKPVSVHQSKEPVANRLASVPGSFFSHMKFDQKLRDKSGEVRAIGSIAYELALTASGVIQYSIFHPSRLWDIAGGVLMVQEAGGAVMTRFPKEKQWHPLESLVPGWEDGLPSVKDLRRHKVALIAGNRQVAPLIASSLRHRFRLSAKLPRLLFNHQKQRLKD